MRAALPTFEQRAKINAVRILSGQQLPSKQARVNLLRLAVDARHVRFKLCELNLGPSSATSGKISNASLINALTFTRVRSPHTILKRANAVLAYSRWFDFCGR